MDGITPMTAPVDQVSVNDIRDDFVPKVAFLSKEFHEREKERLWPKVWQIACREEELPNVGNFIVYDIADESILVVRSAENELKAFYNVCQHRGRILMDQNAGRTKFLFCKYHGWRWSLDGTLEKIQDEDDWKGCPTFDKKDLRLKDVRLDTWGGWVFVNMDLDAEPLLDFLAPVPEYLNFLKFEEWRYRWYRTVILPCNWKTALEGFNEAYHIAATHPQILNYNDDYTVAKTFGRHGMYAYPVGTLPGAPATRTGKPTPTDMRKSFAEFYDHMDETLNAMFTPRAIRASHRLVEEVPEGSDPLTVLMAYSRFHQEEARKEGIELPGLSNQEVGNMGQNWHVFPNHVFLPFLDGSIAYRARPHGDDPNKCVFDIWSMVRYAPGDEPPLVREFFEDWTVDTEARFGKVLAQDFSNFGQVQRGMRSRGFSGSRTNPVQEAEIPNMHRALYEYVFGDD
jgi:phenylpropionate dioxygenase-like ring-hydroxylating dioxygenase large terminal subunit